MAFMPTKMASSRGAVTMMAERSKSMPFLLKPAKVNNLTMLMCCYADAYLTCLCDVSSMAPWQAMKASILSDFQTSAS